MNVSMVAIAVFVLGAPASSVLGGGNAQHASEIYDRFAGTWACTLDAPSATTNSARTRTAETLQIERVGPIDVHVRFGSDRAQLWTAQNKTLVRAASGNGQFDVSSGTASFDGGGSIVWRPLIVGGLHDGAKMAETWSLDGKGGLVVRIWVASEPGPPQTLLATRSCTRT